MEAKYAGIALTGPTQSEWSAPIQIPLNLLTQEAPLVRSESPYLAALGNRSRPVSVRCLRRYATLLDAMEARAMFFDSLPGIGQLELFLTSGGETLHLIADDTVLAPCPSPVPLGRALAWEFNFKTKLFTATREPAPEDPEDETVIRDESGEAITDESSAPILSS